MESNKPEEMQAAKDLARKVQKEAAQAAKAAKLAQKQAKAASMVAKPKAAKEEKKSTYVEDTTPVGEKKDTT